MGNLSKKQIQSFKLAFKADYDIELTDDEARTAAANLLDFFTMLAKAGYEDKQKVLKSSNGTP